MLLLHLGAGPLLVFASCATSDKGLYVNFAGLDFAGVVALGVRNAA